MQRNNSSGYRDGTSSGIDSDEDYHTPTQKEEETSPNSSRKMDSLMDYNQITPKSSSSSGLCSRFTSQKSPKFPPKSSSTNKSVSLTPPSSSSSSSFSSDSDGEYNELKIRNELCCIHLESASRKLEILKKQNEDLELANEALKNELFVLLELWLSINGGGGTNNRVEPSREADPVTSPTSVIGNINQGFESFDEIPVEFWSEEGASSPNSISFRSIVSFLNQPAGTDSSSNRLRFAATPSVRETVRGMQLPIIPAVDENRLIELLELWLSIRDNGGGSTNNRAVPSREADQVTSPTSVIGNINQGFESFDEMPFNSAGTDSTDGTDSTAPSSNTNTNRFRFAATPFVPETVPRMQLPIIPAVDEIRIGGVDEVDPLEFLWKEF